MVFGSASSERTEGAGPRVQHAGGKGCTLGVAWEKVTRKVPELESYPWSQRAIHFTPALQLSQFGGGGR